MFGKPLENTHNFYLIALMVVSVASFLKIQSSKISNVAFKIPTIPKFTHINSKTLQINLNEMLVTKFLIQMNYSFCCV